MEAEVIKLAMSQGIFAVLFVFLLFWVLKENSKREERLMLFFERLDSRLESLEYTQEREFAHVGSQLDRILNKT